MTGNTNGVLCDHTARKGPNFEQYYNIVDPISEASTAVKLVLSTTGNYKMRRQGDMAFVAISIQLINTLTN